MWEVWREDGVFFWGRRQKLISFWANIVKRFVLNLQKIYTRALKIFMCSLQNTNRWNVEKALFLIGRVSRPLKRLSTPKLRLSHRSGFGCSWSLFNENVSSFLMFKFSFYCRRVVLFQNALNYPRVLWWHNFPFSFHVRNWNLKYIFFPSYI